MNRERNYHSSVRFLRTLLNCVLAGGLMAGYLTILFLQLNPAVPLRPSALGPLAFALWVSYGLHAAIFFYVVLVIRQLFAEEPLSPGWVCVKLLACV